MNNTISIHKTSEADIPAIIAMELDKNTAEFIFPNTKEEHSDLIKNKDTDHLILRSEGQKIIGFVILAGLGNKHKSIEFRRIVISEKGKGYGRITIRNIKQYCFETLKCHRLWLDVLEDNDRARHLYRSEGFVEEGVLRECIHINDTFKNLVIMSIVKSEYFKS